MAVRFRLECLLDAREAPEGEVVGLGGKRPVVLHVGGEVGAGLEGEVRVHLILTSRDTSHMCAFEILPKCKAKKTKKNDDLCRFRTRLWFIYER